VTNGKGTKSGKIDQLQVIGGLVVLGAGVAPSHRLQEAR